MWLIIYDSSVLVAVDGGFLGLAWIWNSCKTGFMRRLIDWDGGSLRLAELIHWLLFCYLWGTSEKQCKGGSRGSSNQIL